MVAIGDGMTKGLKSQFALSKLPESVNFVRGTKDEKRSIGDCEKVSESRSADEENFTDPAFDAEMDSFKLKLRKQVAARRSRMRPNVSPRWIDSVRRRLEQ